MAGGPVVTKGASQAKTGARKSARAGGPVVTKAGSKRLKKSDKKVVAMKAGKKRPSVKKSPKPGKPKRKKK